MRKRSTNENRKVVLTVGTRKVFSLKVLLRLMPQWLKWIRKILICLQVNARIREIFSIPYLCSTIILQLYSSIHLYKYTKTLKLWNYFWLFCSFTGKLDTLWSRNFSPNSHSQFNYFSILFTASIGSLKRRWILSMCKMCKNFL